MKQDKVLSMLGLSAKAGNVASGEFSTEKAVKEGKAHLVIVAGDASDNTKKHFRDMCSFYEVPFYAYADKKSIEHHIGKKFRASLTINNKSLNKADIKKLKLLTTE